MSNTAGVSDLTGEITQCKYERMEENQGNNRNRFSFVPTYVHDWPPLNLRRSFLISRKKIEANHRIRTLFSVM